MLYFLLEGQRSAPSRQERLRRRRSERPRCTVVWASFSIPLSRELGLCVALAGVDSLLQNTAVLVGSLRAVF